MSFFRKLFCGKRNLEEKGSKQKKTNAKQRLTDKEMRALLDIVTRKPGYDSSPLDWDIEKYIDFIKKRGREINYKESVIRNAEIAEKLLPNLTSEEKTYILDIARMEIEASDSFFSNKEKTYAMYISITKMAPWNAFAFMEAANAFSDRGDEETAIKYLTKAYEMDPEDSDIKYKFNEMKRGEKIR